MHLIDGGDTSSLSIAGEELVTAILSIPFEKYRVMYKYLAICSYKDMYLEANVTILNAENIPQPASSCTAIFGKWDRKGDPRQHFVREFTHGASDKVTRILLRLHPSDDFGRIRNLVLGGNSLSDLVVQVWSPEIKTYEQTVRLLDSVVSSLFFQIDDAIGVPLRLTHPHWRVRYPRRRSMLKPKTLRFSFAQYEQAPLDLYWYARSVDRMPLLQYLAFYQVLEYFMPSCSQRETISKVRELLAGPTFSLCGGYATRGMNNADWVCSSPLKSGPAHSLLTCSRRRRRSDRQGCRIFTIASVSPAFYDGYDFAWIITTVS